MLERYFVRPCTVDRIRASWLSSAIEQYVTWLVARGEAARNLGHRVPILMQFGTFTSARGVTRYEDLPPFVAPFVEAWITRPDHRRAPGPPRPRLTREIRGPIEQMLRLVVPGFVGHTRRRSPREPFADRVPGFFRIYETSEDCATRPWRTTVITCAHSRRTCATSGSPS